MCIGRSQHQCNGAARMAREIDHILEVVPTAELAIQWDVASEFASLEGVRRHYYQNAWPDIIERMARLAELVPAGVELGYHLCYGDLGHRHFTEPTDTGQLVKMMNMLAACAQRRIDWFHIAERC